MNQNRIKQTNKKGANEKPQETYQDVETHIRTHKKPIKTKLENLLYNQKI